jgi:hypothetical protein
MAGTVHLGGDEIDAGPGLGATAIDSRLLAALDLVQDIGNTAFRDEGVERGRCAGQVERVVVIGVEIGRVRATGRSITRHLSSPGHRQSVVGRPVAQVRLLSPVVIVVTSQQNKKDRGQKAIVSAHGPTT